MRRVPLALVVLLLALPSALAHIDHIRPFIQPIVYPRTVDAHIDGLDARFDLVLPDDPLRQFIRYDIDPIGLGIAIEHRPDMSSLDGAARFEWQITRLVEYADDNLDLAFQPKEEPVARQWRFVGQAWNVSGVRDVILGGAPAKDILWQGATRTGPNITLEVASAGAAIMDEGARIRAQDVIVYLDFTGLPDRDVGRLHALEGRLVMPPGASVALDNAPNATVGLYADYEGRRTFFSWGGEAMLDGRERGVEMTLDEPELDAEGNVTQKFRLHLPQFEDSARFVLVAALEYETPTGRRALIPSSYAVPFVGLAVAVLLSRRR